MSVSLCLLLTAGVLIACGVYLVLERTLSRIVMGFVLAGNGVNLLFIVAAGPPGTAPFHGSAPTSTMTDPLPFALVLTAIVITLGVTALGMALSYRAWQLFGHDEVPDDVEDRRILRRARRRGRGGEEAPHRAHQLSEEHRRGAILHAQRPPTEDEEDPVGSDLTSAVDVAQDPTESDEDAEDPPVGRRTGRPHSRSRGENTDGDD